MFKTTICFLLLLLAAVTLTDSSSSAATDNYIYAVCSPAKFSPGSSYETNLINSLLPSLVTSTATNRYNNLTVPSTSGNKTDPDVTLYGLFQCRGDLDPTTCSSCVSRAVTQVRTLCGNSYCGLVQMENCFVRYDNSSFFGVLDKTVVLKKCGQPIGFNDQDALTRVSDVFGSLGSGSGPYRVGGNGGDVQGVAQCTEDLTPPQCQDCLGDAIGGLRSECGMSQGGYVYLSKCYARFSFGGSHARQTPNQNFGEGTSDKYNGSSGVGKTLAIIIGIVTLIVLLVVFLAFIGKQCRKLQDEKWCH